MVPTSHGAGAEINTAGEVRRANRPRFAPPKAVPPEILLRLLLPLAVTALLLLVTLYPRQSFTLDVGQPGDRLFLSGVYGDERAEGLSYRWTGQGGPAALVVPGWGAVTKVRVDIRAQALPDRAPTVVEVTRGDLRFGTLAVGGLPGWHTLEVAPPSNGTALDLELRAPTATVAGDSRQLGVKLISVRLTPLGVSPALYLRQVGRDMVLPLLATLLALALIARWHGWSGWPARALVAGAMPLGATLFLAWTLALSGYVAALLAVALAVRHAGWLLDALVSLVRALDRASTGRIVAAGAIGAYGLLLTWIAWRVPWIGHADYADNAVVAANLVRGRGFSVDYIAQFYRAYPTVTHPADTWPPLQPLLTVPFFALLGVSTAAAKMPNVVVMVALLSLTYWIGARWWSPRVGLLAALLLALHTYLFNGVLYPVNDLVFSLLALALLVLLALSTTPRDAGGQALVAQPARWQRAYWPMVGVLVGLLYLAKPSGLLLAGGAGVWLLWSAWRQGRFRQVMGGGTVAVLVALLVVAPWLVRNVLTFGVPFYSTEQFDAWILKYQLDEAIYRVYMGRLPLPHPRLLAGYGFDWIAQVNAAQVRKFVADLGGGRLAPVALLPLGALGVILLNEVQRRLWTPLVAAILPYAAFVVLYWHYERRYTLFLLPWLMLAGAAAIWWLHDSIASARGARIAAATALVLSSFIIVPQVGVMWNDAQAAQATPSSVTIARWVAANTPPDAVVMTRNPWELSFHSGRRTVMIPYDNLEAILEIAARYNVTYLQLDHLDDRSTRRPALAPLYAGEERYGFQKVYAAPGWIVYRFPPRSSR